ncbi:unnamed protein product [Calypogeia fissa]
MAMFPGRVTVEIEEAKQELAVLLTRLDEKTAQERDQAKEIDSAKHELAAVKLKYEEQKTAHQEALDKIRFLRLPDADTFSETFRGDVTFVVQASIPRVIHAHRLILAGRSSVFSRMFEAGMQEEQTGRIKINDASYSTMRAVVNYCYTADIIFSGDVHPEEVLKVAHKYDIVPLRKLCDYELSKRVTAENLTEMLRLSRTYEAPSLRGAAMKYFKEHFDTVHEIVLENLLPN